MAMLSWHFIPNDQGSLLKQLMVKVILFDGTGAGLMTGNGDLEAGVCSLTTREQERGKACGCNTEDNLVTGTN
jgi:hypothetical protein